MCSSASRYDNKGNIYCSAAAEQSNKANEEDFTDAIIKISREGESVSIAPVSVLSTDRPEVC